ncbi:cellulose synthase regulator BcsB [Pseudomonas daroniae]|uniref:Cyclic di-GMP-binding protein n=1 Tax=Phytopseudomonas daroniae TaxID=2487519 RepID=A0A4Q9QFE6_9GAMM|nr:cellulose synthase regulator BcsB [Pseudomonas daroniae]TBU78138.1 cellulose synthase regulator BcsB [Pseudomonas sp. FRB 228]TBU87954.1 cellulose synthase regulator BcsB [Pseudomonas daroniae]
MSVRGKAVSFGKCRKTLVISTLLAIFGQQVSADETPVVAPEGENPAAALPVANYRFTLKQLGASYPMNLRGVEGSDSVSFDIRADQVVTQAQLALEYSYSPALLSELSQINVLVNEEVAASLALPKENAGTPQKQVVEIPAHLITEFNRLSLQLIGHYTMQCEDPQHSSLWAKISNASQLQIQTAPLALADDLASLPLPFFDKRDAQPLALPFVFSASPDNAALEAAGALSSWFGALASYRGATFPVSLEQLPEKGNAVVLLSGGAGIAGLDLPETNGPSLSLVGNPNDAFGKLLIVAGRDSQQLKQAATALVLGSQALSGQRAVINRVAGLQPRKPYDAPNWLPSDRPVQIGELIEAKRLGVSGYDPGTISIPLRLPPDLFNWREQGVPLKLKYRYTPQPVSTNSSLLVSVSGKFLKSMALPSREKLESDASLLARLGQGDSLVREATLRLPLESMPLQSSLQLRFMYDYIKQGECRDIIIDNMRGAIEPDSTIDLSGYDHFIAMPNLGVFQGSGYPFTRLADLSETAVILPDGAGPAELSAFLTVLGRFGESTGYPGTAVTVAQAQQVDELRDKDLLVFASGANQPLLQAWADRLPASLDGEQQRFELSDLAFRVRNWISSDPQANLRRSRSSLSLGGEGAGTYLAGFESPLKSGRSVVVIAGSEPEKLAEATAALIGGEDYEQSIQGSLAIVQGTRIHSLVADEQYHVGRLGWFKYLQWLFAHQLWWMLLATALGAAIVTCLLYVSLRARARRRLGE